MSEDPTAGHEHRPSPPSSDQLGALLEQGRVLRRTLDSASRVAELAGEFELGGDLDGLTLARERLDRDEYRVLIVGEIKRGKSTLINSLIGRDLLPKDVEVATSRLFRINHADRESFRIRFEDGSARPLAGPADLAAYGSQVVEDADNTPPLDRMIRWIEVELPFQILPRNVTFFDTPGTGGLKVAHGELTLGILPEADGVVFVLDSEKPVEDSELAFLGEVLKQTPHIFFVQTKVDRREQGWAEIRDKNRQHLLARFGASLPVVEIYPFSSTRFRRYCELMETVPVRKPEADRALRDSRFAEFYPALMTFLYRVVGWSRAANVVLLAERFLPRADKTLGDRWRSLRDDAWREEYRNRQAEKRRWFAEEGAELVKLRAHLFDGLREEISSASHRIQLGLNRIEIRLRREVDSVTTLAEAQGVADDLGEAALRGAAELWRSVRSDLLNGYAEAMSEFSEFSEHDMPELSPDEPRLEAGGPKIQGDLGRRLQTAGGYASSMGVVFGGVPTAGLLVAGVLNPPLGALMAVVGGVATLIGFLAGWRSSRKAEAEVLKVKLSNHLQQAMLVIRPHYSGAVDSLARQLDKSLRQQVDRTTERMRTEAESELKRIDEEERMTASEKTEALKRVELQAARWKQLGQEVAALRVELVQLHDRLVVTGDRH